MGTDTVTSVNSANLVSNSRWNFIAFIITVVINFLTIPVVISFIGLDAFGMSGLIIAIYAPFMMLGTVLGQIVVREFSQDNVIKDDRGRAHFFSSVLFFCASGCILVITVLTAAGGSIISLFVKHSGNLAINSQTGFLTLGIGWAAQQGVLIFQAAVVSTQRYSAIATTSIFSAVVSAISLIICVTMMPNSLGFLIGTSTGFLISIIIWFFLVRRLLPWLFPLPRFIFQQLGRVFRLGKWLGGAHFVSAIANQVDRYVLGVMAPITVVGQYNVAMRLQEVVHMGLLKITEVVFPHFATTTNDSIERRASFFMQVCWIIMLLGLAALGPLISLSNEVITIWVSAEAADCGGQILRTLAIAGVLGSCVNVYFYFTLGTGQSTLISSISIVHALFTVVLTIVFIGVFGPLAAGFGYLVANFLRLAVTLWCIGQYFFGVVSLRTLLLCTFPPLAAGFFIAFLWAYTALLQPNGWVALLTDYIIIACTILIGAVFASIFSKDGRLLINESVLSLWRNFKQVKTCVE